MIYIRKWIMCDTVQNTVQNSLLFLLFIHRFINAYSFVRRSFLPPLIKSHKWYMQVDKPKPIDAPFSKTTMKMHACAQSHAIICTSSIDFYFLFHMTICLLVRHSWIYEQFLSNLHVQSYRKWPKATKLHMKSLI